MSVYVWGSGDCGQLGLGEDELQGKRPQRIAALRDIVDISAGGLHNLALARDGTVYSWGCNDEKALGRGGDEFAVGRVEGLDGVRVTQVACGDSISAVVADGGRLYAWGTFRDSRGVLGFSADSAMQPRPELSAQLKGRVVQVAAGANHLVAVTADGLVFTWGSGEQGQLGRRVLERHRMHALCPQNIAPGRRRVAVRRVACGSYHTLLVAEDGQLFSWGLNNHGQLGLGDTETRIQPSEVALPGRAVAAAAGEHHSLCLLDDGAVYAFGRGDSGQLGSGTVSSRTPIRVDGLPKATAIACGGNHCLALTADGLYSWGYGEMLQLGNGKEEDEHAPHRVRLQKHVLRIEAGGQHSMVLCSE